MIEEGQPKEEKREVKTPKVMVRLKDLGRIKKLEDEMDLNRFYRKFLNKKIMKKRTPSEIANRAIQQ